MGEGACLQNSKTEPCVWHDLTGRQIEPVTSPPSLLASFIGSGSLWFQLTVMAALLKETTSHTFRIRDKSLGAQVSTPTCTFTP